MAFANEFPIEALTDQRASEVVALACEDEFLLCAAAPAPRSRRSAPSRLFAVFDDPGAARACADALGIAEGQDAFAAMAGAAVVLADPCLALGGSTVDVFGDPDRIPAAIRRLLLTVSDRSRATGARAICPVCLDPATVEALRLPEQALPPVPPPWHAAHPELFRILHNGRDLGVFHRNGMTRANAAAALLREGRLPPDLDIDGVGFESVEADMEAGLAPRAPKRRRGTAPTNAWTAERHRKYLRLLRLPDDTPLPPLDRDALRAVAELAAEYDRRRREGLLPATVRQLEFAAAIAKTLEIELPFRLDEATFGQARDFIAEHKPAVSGRKMTP